MREYLFILITLLFSLVIAFVLFFFSYLLIQKKYSFAKWSTYECGFDPFSDTRIQFEIRFYLVAILFIIFDLEVIFLFPWAVTLGFTSLIGLFVYVLISFNITIGFFYVMDKRSTRIGNN